MCSLAFAKDNQPTFEVSQVYVNGADLGHCLLFVVAKRTQDKVLFGMAPCGSLLLWLYEQLHCNSCDM